MMVSFIFLFMTLFFQKGRAFPASAGRAGHGGHGGHGARVVCVGTRAQQHKRECMIGGGVPGSNNLQAADTGLTP